MTPYGKGAAESLLGELLSEHRRDSYVLATKLYYRMSPTDKGLSRQQVAKQIDASLKRLQTDHVDLYQCHAYDDGTPLEETMEALSEVVRAGKARRILKEGQVFNRMHVDDIAAAIKATMANPRLHDLYNLSDDEPAPPQDVIAYACELLGKEAPPLVPLEEADLSDMAKSFYRDNKRVSNKRMKDALNLTLKYPTYREGLSAIAKTSN